MHGLKIGLLLCAGIVSVIVSIVLSTITLAAAMSTISVIITVLLITLFFGVLTTPFIAVSIMCFSELGKVFGFDWGD